MPFTFDPPDHDAMNCILQPRPPIPHIHRSPPRLARTGSVKNHPSPMMGHLNETNHKFYSENMDMHLPNWRSVLWLHP